MLDCGFPYEGPILVSFLFSWGLILCILKEMRVVVTCWQCQGWDMGPELRQGGSFPSLSPPCPPLLYCWLVEGGVGGGAGGTDANREILPSPLLPLYMSVTRRRRVWLPLGTAVIFPLISELSVSASTIVELGQVSFPLPSPVLPSLPFLSPPFPFSPLPSSLLSSRWCPTCCCCCLTAEWRLLQRILGSSSGRTCFCQGKGSCATQHWLLLLQLLPSRGNPPRGPTAGPHSCSILLPREIPSLCTVTQSSLGAPGTLAWPRGAWDPEINFPSRRSTPLHRIFPLHRILLWLCQPMTF